MIDDDEPHQRGTAINGRLTRWPTTYRLQRPRANSASSPSRGVLAAA
jgi:hypothetical protein